MSGILFIKGECDHCRKPAKMYYREGEEKPRRFACSAHLNGYMSNYLGFDKIAQLDLRKEVLQQKRSKQKEKYGYTHSELCDMAERWLKRQGCPITAKEPTDVWGKESPDAIGWKYYGSHIVECKLTRSDFLSDKKKEFRIEPDLGMGRYRYYLAPDGVINESDLPKNWGLLIVKNKRITQAREGKPFRAFNESAEIGVLLWIIRRMKDERRKLS